MKEIIDRMGNMRYAGEKVTFMSSPDHDTYQALTALVDAVAASLEDDSDATPEAVTEGSVKTWRCKLCGYEYEGDVLPEDYVCPICGAGPDQFEEV